MLKKKKRPIYLLLIGILSLLIEPSGWFFTSGQVAAQEGREIFKTRCVSCHNVESPAKTFEERKNRKGPDLLYAGSKFKKDWLVEWLGNPYTIRPAGVMYLNQIKSGKKADEVDESTLKPHVKLTPQESKSVSDYLMTLTSKNITGSIVSVGEKVERRVLREGKKLFEKRYGCYACHRVKGRKKGKKRIIAGGISGPQLLDAGRRLQADWVYAYIKNPQLFDPKVWMPKRTLPESEVKILTKYIMTFK